MTEVSSSPEASAPEEIDIHRAVGFKDEESIHKYVVGGGDVEAKDKDSLTPLHLAAAGGFRTIVEFMIRHNARVDSKSRIGHTPLHLACRFGHEPVVLVLLAEGADLNARDRDDNTPLHKVSADDRKGEVVEPHHVRLLQVEAKVKAASNGKAQLCRELVRRGADIDAQNKTEYTPLHWACFKGHKAAGEQLLKCGANINATSSRKATALFMSAYYGHVDVTFLLLAWGADSSIFDDEGVKPGETYLPQVLETICRAHHVHDDKLTVQVPRAHRVQTQVLFSEQRALLMKGYEATRRNMALMYMRSERSDLNLRMSQGEVETLWGKLTKREKELDMSKIGERDLTMAVKSMKTALEQAREDTKATRSKMASLRTEVSEALREAEEQRQRAVDAERALAELDQRNALLAAASGHGERLLSPGLRRGTRAMSWSGNDHGHGQGRGQSSGERTAADANANARALFPPTSSPSARATAPRDASLARGAAASPATADGGVRARRVREEDAGHATVSRVQTGSLGPQRGRRAVVKRSPSFSSSKVESEPNAWKSSSRSAPSSPAKSTYREVGRGRGGSGTSRSSAPILVPSLPTGRIAELASAINERVAELGATATVPFPPATSSDMVMKRSGSASSLASMPLLGAAKRGGVGGRRGNERGDQTGAPPRCGGRSITSVGARADSSPSRSSSATDQDSSGVAAMARRTPIVAKAGAASPCPLPRVSRRRSNDGGSAAATPNKGCATPRKPWAVSATTDVSPKARPPVAEPGTESSILMAVAAAVVADDAGAQMGAGDTFEEGVDAAEPRVDDDNMTNKGGGSAGVTLEPDAGQVISVGGSEVSGHIDGYTREATATVGDSMAPVMAPLYDLGDRSQGIMVMSSNSSSSSSDDSDKDEQVSTHSNETMLPSPEGASGASAGSNISTEVGSESSGRVEGDYSREQDEGSSSRDETEMEDALQVDTSAAPE